MSEQLRGEELGGRSYHMGMGLYRRLYAGQWRGGVKERLEGTGGSYGDGETFTSYGGWEICRLHAQCMISNDNFELKITAGYKH